MLNKKILAASIAAAISTNAFAAVDLDAESGAVKVASDSLAYTTAVTADANGNGTVDFAANTALTTVTTNVGFSIATGANRFVRFDLTNASFDDALVDGDLAITAAAAAGAAASIGISAGGQVGDDFVIYEISDDNDIVQTDDFTLTLNGGLRVDGNTVNLSYRLYETGVAAIAGNDQVLADTDYNVISFASSKTGQFASVETATATVTSNFTQFDPVAATAAGFADADTARLGTLTPADLLGASFVDVDGTPLILADVYDADQTLSLEGDFSFGFNTATPPVAQWYFSTANNCASQDAPLTLNTAQDQLTRANYDVTAGAVWYLCVDVNGTEVIVDQTANIEGSLLDDGVSDEFGQTNYDTTNIKVPILTTFDGYNQRIFITNNSSTAANYTTSFTSEDGVVADSGSKGSGTVPAGEMIVIKAVDLADITGGTRANAVIRIEAEESQIEAVSQTVNLATKTTDTVVLTVDGPDADEI